VLIHKVFKVSLEGGILKIVLEDLDGAFVVACVVALLGHQGCVSESGGGKFLSVHPQGVLQGGDCFIDFVVLFVVQREALVEMPLVGTLVNGFFEGLDAFLRLELEQGNGVVAKLDAVGIVVVRVREEVVEPVERV